MRLGMALTAIGVLATALLSGCNGDASAKGGTLQRNPAAGIHFREVAAERGVRFKWGHGGKSPLTALETFGCGCAFLDANEDGWLDILLVGEPACGLFLNDGSGKFADVSQTGGVAAPKGQWKGCAVGDFTGDGHDDLILTGYRVIAALQGNGQGNFKDITAATSLTEKGWGSSAGLMDLDTDGDLDLVVGHYVIFGPNSPQYCSLGPGVRTGCPPRTYDPEFTRIFRNDGKGRFTDVTAGSGLEKTHGKALVFAFADYDGDGKTDFYIGNDGTPADLMRNLGGLRFDNEAVAMGVAMGVYNQAQAAMGADWGDYDRDGRLDLVVTAFSREPYSVYHHRGAFFENTSTQNGVAEATKTPLGFGVEWLDADNDGMLDLVFANGHVYDGVAKIEPESTYLQPLQFLRNVEGHFEDESARSGDFLKPILGRGLASGDFDNDGRIDLLVVDYEGEVVLLHNESEPAKSWLQLQLAGPKGNRWAYGARVVVSAAGIRYVEEVSPTSSYLSSSAPWLHFGLGPASDVEKIEVRWPNGKNVRYPRQTLNQRLRLGPDGSAEPIKQEQTTGAERNP